MEENTESPGTSSPSLEDRIAALEAKVQALVSAADRHADALTVINCDLDTARRNGGLLACPVTNVREQGIPVASAAN